MSASGMRIGAILWKEWHELRQLRSLIWGAFGLPMLFTVIPLGALFAMRLVNVETEMADFEDMIGRLASDPGFAALGNREKLQVAMGRPMSTFILLLPVMIPSMVASYSIVGEKTSQTLEPLLATPIRTWELLFAKMLTAFIPTLVLTWFFAGLFALGARAVAVSDAVFAELTSGPWLIAVILLAPALSMLAIAITVGISSRAKDPRSAQEVSSMLVMPIVLMIPAQLSGFLLIDTTLVLVASAVFVALAVVAVFVVQRLFEREWILTRWR
jgi:ABC-2 type transport system permease protein